MGCLRGSESQKATRKTDGRTKAAVLCVRRNTAQKSKEGYEINSILSDFFHGNLYPESRKMVRGSEFARITEELAKTGDSLEQKLPPELLPLLKQFTDAQTELIALTAETYYIDGFKTGARIIMDVQDDTYRNLEPVSA